MGQSAGGIRQPREQPRHLGDALVATQLLHAAGGDRPRAVFHHPQMVGGERGDLGEVGGHRSLPAPCAWPARASRPADLDGGGAADFGIHLVDTKVAHRAPGAMRPRWRA